MHVEDGDQFAGATDTFIVNLFNGDGNKRGNTTHMAKEDSGGQWQRPASMD